MSDELAGLIEAAYWQGAQDVHDHWQEDRDPDFSEAATDYRRSVEPAILAQQERISALEAENARMRDEIQHVVGLMSIPGQGLTTLGARAVCEALSSAALQGDAR